jgi:hypothetical protein
MFASRDSWVEASITGCISGMPQAQSWRIGAGHMKHLYLTFGLLTIISIPALADDPPVSAAVSTAQAQARQFGMFLGGTATQYDLCAKKGFLAKSDPSAEDQAGAYIEKMRATTPGPDQFAYVQEGWQTIKREVSQHESFFTQEKCSGVGKEWAKILLKMRSK